MKKGVVFFSHSSQDGKYVSRLREAMLSHAGDAFETFCSSDGESIPFGTNWTHKIEAALHDADLVFIFMSPASATSQWVFFEAGFCYGRQMRSGKKVTTRVVPLGIRGVNVGHLRPPMGLLQGFNLENDEKLNNLLTIVNEEFQLKIKDFPQGTFDTIFYDDAATGQSFFRNSHEAVRRVTLSCKFPDLLKKLHALLTEEGSACVIRGQTLETYGLELSLKDPATQRHFAVFSPDSVDINFRRLDALAAKEDALEFASTVLFHPQFKLLSDPVVISGKLIGSGVVFGADGFKFRGIDFKLGKTKPNEWVYIEAKTRGKSLTDSGLNDLTDIFVERGIVSTDGLDFGDMEY